MCALYSNTLSPWPLASVVCFLLAYEITVCALYMILSIMEKSEMKATLIWKRLSKLEVKKFPAVPVACP